MVRLPPLRLPRCAVKAISYSPRALSLLLAGSCVGTSCERANSGREYPQWVVSEAQANQGPRPQRGTIGVLLFIGGGPAPVVAAGPAPVAPGGGAPRGVGGAGVSRPGGTGRGCVGVSRAA